MLIHGNNDTPLNATSNALNVAQPATRSVAITADTLVVSGARIYRGYTVTVATATAAIEIRDATAAGGGVIIDVIPAGTAAGTTKARNTLCTTGVYVDYAATATGTLIVEYQ